MKRRFAAGLAALLLLCLLGGCGRGGEVSWEEYQAWLVQAFRDRSPDPEGMEKTILATESWEEIDVSVPPWDFFFAADGYDASTWEEFCAAGGVGTFHEDAELPRPPWSASGEGG